eukprot:333467_1
MDSSSQYYIVHSLWIMPCSIILFYFAYYFYVALLWWRRYKYGINIDAVITNKWSKNKYDKNEYYYSTSTYYYIQYKFYVKRDEIPSILYPILMRKFLSTDNDDIFPSDIMNLCIEYLGNSFIFWYVHGPYIQETEVNYDLYRNIDNVIKILCDSKYHSNHKNISYYDHGGDHGTVKYYSRGEFKLCDTCTTMKCVILTFVIITCVVCIIGLITSIQYELIAMMVIIFSSSIICSCLCLVSFIWLNCLRNRLDVDGALQCAYRDGHEPQENELELLENENLQIVNYPHENVRIELQFGD